MRDKFNLIELYLQDIKSYKLLTKEQEQELFKELNEADDSAKYEEIRHKIIISNLRLVISIAKKNMYSGLPLIDLISEGNLGLIKAINKFDYTKGHRFSTYAVWWIKQSIKKSIINKGRDIRIPSYKYEQLSKVNKYIMNYMNEHGEVPTTSVIAKALDIKHQKIKDLLNEFQDVLSLNESIGDNICLEDIVGKSDDIEKQMILDEQLIEMKEKIGLILSERERLILNLRYGLSNGEIHTLKEIGKELGLTRERVRQIEKAALIKLKESFQK